MRKKHTIFLAILLITINAFGQSKPIATVPFTVEKSCIYFYCKVNNSDSLKFLFDTGADGSVINKKSQDKVILKIDGQSLNIGANGSNTVELSSNNTISIGTLSQEKVSFTLIPYETAAFDGVMGTDIMEKYVIEIDYGKKELRFYLPSTFQKDLSLFEKNNIYFPNNYLSIKSSVIIRGKKYKGFFGLDTGADDLLTISSPFSKKNDFVKKAKVIGSSTSQGSDGSTFEEPLVLMPEIRFSSYRFYNIFTNLSNAAIGGLASKDKAGFFGNDFLKRFDIVLDITHKRIYFKPNNNLYKPFYE